MPTWSPYGDKILYDRDEGTCSNPKDIYMMNPDGTGKVPFYPPAGQNDDGNYQRNNDWGTHGKILFTQTTGSGTNQQLMTINDDGTELYEITDPDSESIEGYCWAFDNNNVIYQAAFDGDNQIWMCNADGTERVQLTFGPSNNSYADFILNSEITGAWIIVDNYYYSNTDTYEYSAQADVITTSACDHVFVKGIPGITDPESVELQHEPFLNGFFGSGTSIYDKYFNTPPPGVDWEGDYEFYIQGEPSVHKRIYEDTIKQWDFVQNVTVTGGFHPTITWEPIDGFDNGRYQVRFMLLDQNGKPDRSKLIWQSPSFADLNLESYSYTYEGNLIEQYGTIAISIEATENPLGPDDALRNRSIYYAIHHVCVGSFDNDSDKDGSDLAMFIADFGRTDCDVGDPCVGDLDGDSDVDEYDLSAFASGFGITDCGLSDCEGSATHITGYWGDPEWENIWNAEDGDWNTASSISTANKYLYMNHSYDGNGDRYWQFKYSSSGSQHTVFDCYDYSSDVWTHVWIETSLISGNTVTEPIPEGCLSAGQPIQLRVLSASSAEYYEGNITCEE